jgi:hypothetical protein
MTAVIGFVNQETIIMASDSQMSSYPYSTAKQVGYPKLGSVMFSQPGSDDRHFAMIAKAGVLMTANHFEDLFTAEAAKMRPGSPRAIANLAEKTMKQGRAEIMGLFAETCFW